MPEESASIKAIKLTRTVFEAIHGNLGLLKFNVEELTPTNGTNGEESKKWKIICSFFETLGSSAPSRYEVAVSLTENTITIKKLGSEQNEPATTYVVEEKKKAEG